MSAESIKRVAPDIGITLFTDRRQNPLCDVGCFDAVHEIESVGGFGQAWSEGQLDRIVCLQRTPYDRTLNLDTDTRVYTPAVRDLFGILDSCDLAMVEDPHENSYAAAYSGRRMFNAGLILYQRSDAVMDTLNTWEQRVRRNFSMALVHPLPKVPELEHIPAEDVRRKLLRIDQIALMEIVSPDFNRTNLTVQQLGKYWNYRGARPRDGKHGKINILHSDDLKSLTKHDILRVAYDWREEGRGAGAELLYDYVGAYVPEVRKRESWLSAILRRKSHAMREVWATPELKSVDLHLRYGQLKQAAFALNKAVRPDTHAQIFAGQSRAALAIGEIGEALMYAAKAAEVAPKSGYVASVQGAALMASGRLGEAEVCLTKAASVGYLEATRNLAQLWLAKYNDSKAAQAFSEVLAINPADAAAANNLLPALLAQRRDSEVIARTDDMLLKNVRPTAALAFKSIALAELGRGVELDELVNFDTLISVEELVAPKGFQSIADFNRALAAELINERSLVYEPKAHTTRRGKQSGGLANSPSLVIQALNAQCIEAAKRRIAAIRANSNHPFDRRAPRTYRLHSWAVVLGQEGHQTPHIHPDGWLSGVYYVEIPDDVKADDLERSGWLEFGRSDERWHRKSTKTQSRTVFPREGQLITFPSYFWHSTRPLRSDRRRISFAFDIMPA
ncbi:MAG: hypothetical protein JNK21_00770 [Rhodospirillaceae bacterium]|nr:hypothetical protein [Rhodospirillaceae bacterium]